MAKGVRPDPMVLHVVEHQKFIPAFIELVEETFDPRQHHFFFVHNGALFTRECRVGLTRDSDFRGELSFLLELARQLNCAPTIVLHGLFNSRLVLLLFLQPWLLRKCCWIIWGGDLYTHVLNDAGWRWRIKEIFRRRVIRRFGHLATYLSGDVTLARKWYGAKGRHHECICYPSNTVTDVSPPAARTGSVVRIQVGNSGDPTNNHIEVFEILARFKGADMQVFCPLSYGNPDYSRRVIEAGGRMFGQKFIPMVDFMPLDAYLEYLRSIDVAIFNHRRQQAMGNIVNLLGAGKTVYVRKETTQWQFMVDRGIKVHDVNDFNLTLDAPEVVQRNIQGIAAYFSRDNLKRQLAQLFDAVRAVG